MNIEGVGGFQPIMPWSRQPIRRGDPAWQSSEGLGNMGVEDPLLGSQLGEREGEDKPGQMPNPE
jgi:hypothetical protein